MTPVSFDGCFGWLHIPPTRLQCDIAVLICPPLGSEALLSHRSLRALADDLAAAGYPTLRFDYPGTGDSCDGEIADAGGHWQAWRCSVDAAANWLRNSTGAGRLIAVGVRAGGLLAASAAAERDDIDALILLEPVLQGRSYVRQLYLEAELIGGQPIHPRGGLALREFRFAPSTVTQISRIELGQIKFRPGLKVAIFAQQQSKLLADCLQSLRGSGANIVRLEWTGLEPLLRPYNIKEDELADFSTALNWLRRSTLETSEHTDFAIEPPALAELSPPNCVETPLRFGKDEGLFGILCGPDRGKTGAAVIIVSGGRDPHYGAARHAVFMARRLAQAGIASLRMDFAGLGDSLGPRGQADMLSPVFAQSRNDDVRAAIDALQQLGFERFGMQGLCAGAYHAFLAGLIEHRLSFLLLINMPLFLPQGTAPRGEIRWRHMSFRTLYGKFRRSNSRLALLLRHSENWRLILYSQASRIWSLARRQLSNIAGQVGIYQPVSFAKRALASLSARGVQTLFLFSGEEDALAPLQHEFGDPNLGLSCYPGTAWQVIGELDHEMILADGREVAEDVMIKFIIKNSASR